MIKKFLGPIILLIILQGCAAVWGATYKVIASNEKSISIILQKKDLIMGKKELDITGEVIKIVNSEIKEFKIK